MKLVLALGVALPALALATGCGATTTKTVTQTVTTIRTVTGPSAGARPCTGPQLSGKFAVVPGSAGAGQIEYLLTLRNTSHRACSVRGLPQGKLLRANGSPLPTHVASAGRGRGSPIVVEPGASTTANARFSPDIAGTGDSQRGPCQPQAHTFQVTPNGGGVTEAAMRPPTSVCERGTLHFEPFDYAG